MGDIDDSHVTLSWAPTKQLPKYEALPPVSYKVEMRHPPHYDWREFARDIPETYLDVDLPRAPLLPTISHKDYSFRIRAVNKFGLSEPSRPVSVADYYLQPDFSSIAPFLPPPSELRPRQYYGADIDLALGSSKMHKPHFPSTKIAPADSEHRTPHLQRGRSLPAIPLTPASASADMMELFRPRVTKQFKESIDLLKDLAPRTLRMRVSAAPDMPTRPSSTPYRPLSDYKPFFPSPRTTRPDYDYDTAYRKPIIPTIGK